MRIRVRDIETPPLTSNERAKVLERGENTREIGEREFSQGGNGRC